jgi:hypothetical protein
VIEPSQIAVSTIDEQAIDIADQHRTRVSRCACQVRDEV